MAPKRDAAWAADRSAKCMRRSFALNYLGQKKEIKDALENHPHCIPQLRNALVDMGLLAPLGMRPIHQPLMLTNDGGAFNGVPRAHPPASPTAGAAQEPAVSAPPQPNDVQAAVDRKIVPAKIPPAIIYFVNPVKPAESLNTAILQYLLSEVESGVFSLPAQKVLAPGARRAVPISILQELFESVFDLGPASRIPENWYFVADMLTGLKRLNLQNNRFGLTLALPPRWKADHGHHALIYEPIKNTARLNKKFEKGSIVLTNEVLGLPAKTKLSDLHIENNFSKTRAILMLKGTLSEWSIPALFVDEDKSSSSAGKPVVNRRVNAKTSASESSKPTRATDNTLTFFGMGGRIIHEERLEPPLPPKKDKK
jgi:hypothetical protein